MKTLYIAIGFGVALLGTTSQAQTIILDDHNSYNEGGGGEFSATPSSGLSWIASGYSPSALMFPSAGQPAGTFTTFCIQTATYFTPPGTYNVAFSSGSVGSGDQKEPIAQGTAWLYSQFARGTLAGYDYANDHKVTTTFATRNDSAYALQQVFWYLQKQPNYGGYAGYSAGESQFSGNVFWNLVVSHFGSDTAAEAAASAGYDGVYAMNLSSSGVEAQNQLVYFVPEPSTMAAVVLMVLPFGASALRILRRRSSAA